MRKKVILFLFMMIMGVILVACDFTITPNPPAETKTKTITFETNGGTSINPITFENLYDASWLSRFTTTRSGFDFVSWHTSQDLLESSIAKGVFTESLTLYAKWQENENDVFYVITFVNYNLETLVEIEVKENTLPIYDGKTPLKLSDDEFDYTFNGWTPVISVATQNQTYTATFKQTVKQQLGTFNPSDLNALFGYDVYAKMPAIVSSDWEYFDDTEEGFIGIYIDLFDWEASDYAAYIALLDSMLTYDAEYDEWLLDDLFIYVYLDDTNYDAPGVYSINIYTFDEGGGTVDPVTTFDPSYFNQIIGFDLYSWLPNIMTQDYLVEDYTNEDEFALYLSVFDWTEANAYDYYDLLDATYIYDETEDAFNVNGTYVRVVYDDEVEPIVYGLEVYRYQNTPIPVDPVEGVYYQFNIQDATNIELGYNYASNVDQAIIFSNSVGKVDVIGSHFMMISGSSTPPAGLTQGVVFATNVKDGAKKDTSLEISTKGNQISSVTFEIQGRTGFKTNFIDAYIEVYNGSSWVALENGNFYSQIAETKTTITVDNLNSDHFRFIFKGTNGTSNGGQFMLFNVILNEGSQTYATFADMIDKLENNFNDMDLGLYVPTIVNSSDFSIARVKNNHFLITATFTAANKQQVISQYYDALEDLGWILDEELSLSLETSVYLKTVSDTKSYTLYLSYLNETITLNIYSVNQTAQNQVPETLDYMKSLNDYQVANFDYSGLPSTGDVSVLVVPVEINGTPFPSNYLSKLEIAFNGTSKQTGWESVSSYYDKSSLGRLNLDFDILTKYTTNFNRSHYEAIREVQEQVIILETLKALDSTVDFSKYDANFDGVIDSVVFIYSVNYDYDVAPWWAYVFIPMDDMYQQLTPFDGKEFEYYMWASYQFLTDSVEGNANVVVNAETYIHEMGHLFGLNDYYTYFKQYTYGALGGFDMMDFNSGDHGPLNKLHLGWIKSLYASQGHYQVTLDAYTNYESGLNQALIIPKNGATFDKVYGYSEFLIIMFYKPEGLYEGHLGKSHVLDVPGLVIYHVDASLAKSDADYWSFFAKENLESTSQFFIRILEADKGTSLLGDKPIANSDILRSGTLDLSSFKWNDNTSIDVLITLSESLNNAMNQAVFEVSVGA